MWAVWESQNYWSIWAGDLSASYLFFRTWKSRIRLVDFDFYSEYFTSGTGRVAYASNTFQIGIFFLSSSWCVHIVYFIFITNYEHTVCVIGTQCISNANNADVIIQKINSCSLPFVCSSILVFEFCSFFAISVDFPLRFFHYTVFFLLSCHNFELFPFTATHLFIVIAVASPTSCWNVCTHLLIHKW